MGNMTNSPPDPLALISAGLLVRRAEVQRAKAWTFNQFLLITAPPDNPGDSQINKKNIKSGLRDVLISYWWES